MLTYFFLVATAAAYSGVRTSLHISALENFKDNYIPAVIESVAKNGLGWEAFDVNLLIASITVNVTRTTFADLSIDIENSSVEFDTDNQTIWLKLNGLQMDMTSTFRYHTYTTGWTDGEFYLYLEGGSLTIPMTVGVDSEGRLDFNIAPITQNFLDVEYQFSTDSYLMDILAFIGSIPPFTYLDSLITNLLFARSISAMSRSLHEHLLNMPYTATAGPLFIDYHFQACNITNDHYIEALANGTFYVKDVPVAVAPPAVDEDWAGGSQFRVMFTNYTLETLASALYQSGMLAVNITSKNIPPSIPFPLTTTGLATLLPALKQTFGDKKPVELRCTAAQQPLLQVANMVNISFFLNCDVVVITTEPTLALTLILQLDSQANVTLARTSAGTYVLGTINTDATAFSRVGYTNSAVGKVNLNTFKGTLSFVAKVIAELIDSNYLAPGVALPLPNGMTLTNSSSLVSPTFIEVDATADFSAMVSALVQSLYAN